MATALRDEVVAALDEYLRIDGVDDSALNGLQVEGAAHVTKVGMAVDAAQATIDAAAAADCDLLVVHHGLFWGPQVALKGIVAGRVRACFAHDLSLYAAHLPLDAHPEIGNNVLLAAELGGVVDGAFGNYGGIDIGALATLDEPTDIGGLAGRLVAAGCADPLIWSFGGETIETIAVVTGRGNSVLEDAVAAGADCFVTGEPIQEAYHAARDHGIHCLFGGHYATETFGVRAVGEWLEARFDVELTWIEHPTGI